MQLLLIPLTSLFCESLIFYKYKSLTSFIWLIFKLQYESSTRMFDNKYVVSMSRTLPTTTAITIEATCLGLSATRLLPGAKPPVVPLRFGPAQWLLIRPLISGLLRCRTAARCLNEFNVLPKELGIPSGGSELSSLSRMPSPSSLPASGLEPSLLVSSSHVIGHG